MKQAFFGFVVVSILIANAGAVNAAPGAHHQRPHGPVDFLPATAAHLVVEGVKYWLSDGVYYRKAGEHYVVVDKAPGLRHLPKGAVLVKRGGKDYFRHGDIVYRWVPEVREYQVVELAVSGPAIYQRGSVLESLPDGAYAKKVNGVQYFTLNGQFFMPSKVNGKAVYVVVDIDAD